MSSNLVPLSTEFCLHPQHKHLAVQIKSHPGIPHLPSPTTRLCQITLWSPPPSVSVHLHYSTLFWVTTLSHRNYCGRFLRVLPISDPHQKWLVWNRHWANPMACKDLVPKELPLLEHNLPLLNWCLIILAILCSMKGSCQCWRQVLYCLSHYTTSKKWSLIPTHWIQY